MTCEQISRKGGRNRQVLGRPMRWLKRMTSKRRRRLWRELGELAPYRVTRGWAD